MGQHAVVFALNANSCFRAPVLSALCIVLQAWTTMKISLIILIKTQRVSLVQLCKIIQVKMIDCAVGFGGGAQLANIEYQEVLINLIL